MDAALFGLPKEYISMSTFFLFSYPDHTNEIDKTLENSALKILNLSYKVT